MALMLRRGGNSVRIVAILGMILTIAVLWSCSQTVIEHICKWRAEYTKCSHDSLRQWAQVASDRTALELFKALRTEEEVVQRDILTIVLEKRAELVQQFVSCITMAPDDELLESFRIRFGEFRSGEQILQQFCQMLEVASDSERVTVLDLIRRLGWYAVDALPACYSKLGDPSWKIREGAAYAICSIGRLELDYERMVKVLEEDGIAEVRRAAAMSLSAHARFPVESTRSVCRALGKAYLGDPSGEVRQACLASLRDCNDQAVVADFVNKGLQDQDKLVRVQAASQFVPFGNTLSDPRKPLLLLLADEELLVRQAAVRAVMHQGSWSYSSNEISFAVDLLLANKVGPREAEVIGAIAGRDLIARKRLISAMLESEENTKLLSIKALGASGKDQDSEAALRQLNSSDSRVIRDAATEALGRYSYERE